MKPRITKRYLQAYAALYSNAEPPKSKPTVKRRYIEDNLVQRPLVKRARLHPICRDHLFHIPNGGRMSLQAGDRMRARGVLPGVSDLFLAYPVEPFAGFYIECKAPGKKPSAAQQEFMQRMRKAGYKAEWYDHWPTAWQAIEEYLAGEKQMLYGANNCTQTRTPA